MEQKLYDKLKAKYPKLFEGDGSLNDGLMCFGIECGDGWYALLDHLFEKITKVAPDTVLFQVKEKFGGLRVYTGPTCQEVYDLIECAEIDSYNTCELCGAKGELKGDSWMITRCPNCA